MARTPPGTVLHIPGDLVTGRVWNNGPKALNDFLSNRPAFRGRTNSNQSILDNTWTPLQWLITLLDTDNGHSVSVNNQRYTCQVAGWYWCKGNIAWNTGGAFGAVRIDTAIAVNSSIVLGSCQFLTKGNGSLSAQQGSCLVHLNVGDFVEFWTKQHSGATQTIDLGFGIECGFDVLWQYQ